MKRRSSYKITFLDREGPEGILRLKAAGYASIVFGFSMLMFGVLGSKMLELNGLSLIGFTLVCAFTLATLSMIVALRVGNAAGSGASLVYMGGGSTPYEEQFSQEEALVMQRDYAAALELYEQRISATPNEPRARIAAADLYAQFGENPKRAAELYREVQRIPELAGGHDVYVSNKLADLYLGPLDQPGRALVEFRRLVEKYPGSKVAGHARSAIANLKPDMVKDL